MDLCRHLGDGTFYMPSAFYIKLNITIDFENNFVCGKRQNMAVFLHEYIHYLQDITTTYGYLQIHNKLEYLVGLLHAVQNDKSRQIRRQILHDELSEQLEQFLDYTTGDVDDDSYADYDSIEIRSISPSFTKEEISDLASDNINECKYWRSLTTPVLKLSMKRNHKTIERSFNFGSMAISESMAYLVQNHVCPSTNVLYRIIQYDIAKILYNYVIGECNDELVVELCDISLMDNNPGAYFYHVLLCMKAHHYIPEKAGDIFKFTNKYSSPFTSIFNNNYCYATESIKKLFQGDPQGFLGLQEHLLSAMGAGMHIRNSNFGFIYKIMTMPTEKAFTYWRLLVHDLKLPFIITKDNECFGNISLADERFDEYFFLGYNALYNILKKGRSITCELLPVCTKQLNDIVDDNCKTGPDPWNKLSRGDKCPLAVLWEMWQLNGRTVCYD